jgi:hypothetical protein
MDTPSPNHCDVNHVNKARSDNRISNLQWDARSQNSKHSHRVTFTDIHRQAARLTPATVRPLVSLQ